jgi:hypothetical protein
MFIVLGIGLYRDVQLGVTTTNLHRSLARFLRIVCAMPWQNADGRRPPPAPRRENAAAEC